MYLADLLADLGLLLHVSRPRSDQQLVGQLQADLFVDFDWMRKVIWNGEGQIVARTRRKEFRTDA